MEVAFTLMLLDSTFEYFFDERKVWVNRANHRTFKKLKKIGKKIFRHICGSFFFNKKRLRHRLFSREFSEIFKNTFFTEQVRTTILNNWRNLTKQIKMKKITEKLEGTDSIFIGSRTIDPGKSCEICSKLIIKTPKRNHWRCSCVFIVNFEHIPHLFLFFLIWTGIYLLGGAYNISSESVITRWNS